MRNALKLYLVTDRDLSLGRSLEEVVREAVAGGVTMVQLREKDAATGEFIELGRRLMAVLKPLGIPLIINDRVDVALAIDADGVHIGQSDMSYADARRLLGPDKIIGLSVENMDDLLKAIEAALGHSRHHVVVTLPYSMGGMVDTLHSGAQVLNVEYTGEGIEVETVLDPILYGRMKEYIIKEC